MAGPGLLLDTIGALLPAAKQAGKAAAKALPTVEALPGIRAWHASPHDFDRFDLSKIGTGQGAASYGKGIYAAENARVSGVGGEYWKDFANQMRGDAARRGLTNKDYALDVLIDNHGDRNRAIEYLKYKLDRLSPGSFGHRDAQVALDELTSGRQVGPRVYELNIKAQPEQFLDWDKPLKQQMHHVEALPQLLDAAKDEAYGRALAATNKPRADELWGMVKNPTEATGQLAMQELGRDPDKAMLMMRDAGIPGIRYLDQGSRPTADLIRRERDRLTHWENIGAVDTPQYREVAARLKQAEATPTTYNYVLNNPDIIDILRKLAIPGVVGGGAATAYQPQGQ
jgi:hypothetical protein